MVGAPGMEEQEVPHEPPDLEWVMRVMGVIRVMRVMRVIRVIRVVI